MSSDLTPRDEPRDAHAPPGELRLDNAFALIEGHPPPSISDPREVNKALTEIFNAILANKIDRKRATALLYALQVYRQG